MRERKGADETKRQPDEREFQAMSDDEAQPISCVRCVTA
jgi:hypothetical protein